MHYTEDSMRKEYIVSLRKGIDYDEFWTEMESLTVGHSTIPAHAVDIVNSRPLSLRNCHYALIDEEAARLRSDPRVLSVEIPPEHRTDIEIGFNATQTGVFDKSTTNTVGQLNWGLLRSNAATNIFGSNNQLTLPYEYMLDGTGVDVVIQDSGIEPNHPEFFDYTGTGSRIQLINWYTVSGVPGTQSANHYLDTHGHGTHVASTAVGLRHGWAKNAKIYSVKVGGLEGGNGDAGSGLPQSTCFDVIKGFHLNKPIDPVTGVRRPTIVNMSWGYGGGWGTVTGGVYRGVSYTGGRDTSKGLVGRNGRYPVLVGSVEVDMDELLDAGVHVCAAASNDSQKIDVPGGVDYNNYFFNTTQGNTALYYHRGSSPMGDDRALCVGAIDGPPWNATLDKKVIFSNAGPGVNIFAPGTNIQSATSTTTVFSTVAYTSPFPGPPAPAPELIPFNARLTPLFVNSNSFICQKNVLTYNNYTKSVLGAHILLGAETYPDQADAASIGVWAGTFSNGNGYKIRYEGYADYNANNKFIIWEVTLWRNNWIEILVLRHDDATQAYTYWGLYNEDTTTPSSSATLSPFRSDSLSGDNPTARSLILRTGPQDPGQLWTEESASRVRDNGDGTFSQEAGVTVENGQTGLTQIMGPGDEVRSAISTPFDFIFFNQPPAQAAANNFKEARISGTSMASPQVCGVGAQLLQLRPELTPTQLKDLLIEYSTPTIRTTGLDNDYADQQTIWGASQRVLRNPFGKPANTFNGQFRNGVQFKRR